MDRLGAVARAARAGGSVVPRARSTPRPARRSSPGMGELHLEIIVDRLLREFGVAGERRPAAGRLQGDDHAQPVRVEGRYIKQTGGSGDYARRRCSRSSRASRARASRSRTRSRARPSRASSCPPSSRAARRRRRAACSRGYPVVDVAVRLLDGQAHEVDSSERSFKIAGVDGDEGGAARKAKPVLLEPHHGGRGRDARGVRRRACRATSTAGAASITGFEIARQRAGDPRRGAARGRCSAT